MSPEPLSSVVAGLVAAKPPPPPTAEEKNVIVWARGADTGALPAREGPLVHVAGGITNEVQLRPRIVAFLGPDATMRGLAEAVKPIVDRAVGAGAPVDLPTLALALLQYNRAYLQPPALASWRVGLRVTLPIEIDLGADFTNAPVLTAFVANRNRVRELAAQAPATWSAVVNRTATPLALPDPVALRAAVAARVAAATATQLADDVWPRWLANPYDVVFEFAELMRQLRTAGTVLEFVLSLFDRIGREQALMLGTTTGGHAALRAAWRVLAETDRTVLTGGDVPRYDRARTVTAAGLALTPDGAGGWRDILVQRPGAVALEPPLTRGQQTASAGNKGRASFINPPANEDSGGRRQHVLGRNITVGIPAEAEGNGITWKGWSYGGRIDPATTIANHGAEIGTAGAADPLLASCLKIAVTIAPNEGWLDASRAADMAMLSFGIQQWSVHTNNEATVVLRRFKEHDPEGYDLFFGMHGLDVRMCGPGADEGSPESDPGVVAANPEAGGVAPFGRFFPRLATFWSADPGQPLTLLRVPAGAPRASDARTHFFAGKALPANAKRVDLPEPWCARVRMATIASVAWRIVQLESAAYRFNRIKIESPRGTVAGVPRAASDLFTSEFAAALLLDHHINGPGNVRRAIQRAIDRIPGTVAAMSDDWLIRFAVDYMGVRRLADKAGRDDWILRNHDVGRTAHWPGLAPEPRSFVGWPP